MSNMAYSKDHDPGSRFRRRTTRASELTVGIVAVALLASAHTFAGAAENPARLAQLHHACAVVMGLHQSGDLYDTCTRSLSKTLSEQDQKRAALGGRSACARRGLMPGSRAFAVCVVTTEQLPADPGSQQAVALIH
jgi:hypothetical protein